MERQLIAALAATCLALAGCGGKPPPEEGVEPEPAPLPTAGIAGRPVTVYPLSMLWAAAELGWQDQLGDRPAALAHADSVILEFLTVGAPEVTWIPPEELRKVARQAPNLIGNPDQLGTSMLRGSDITKIPDPLRAQMRNLTGIAGDRFALVPAALTFERGSAAAAEAKLVVVLADVRFGQVGWRTVARGEGEDPWSALWEALKTLVPDLP